MGRQTINAERIKAIDRLVFLFSIKRKLSSRGVYLCVGGHRNPSRPYELRGYTERRESACGSRLDALAEVSLAGKVDVLAVWEENRRLFLFSASFESRRIASLRPSCFQPKSDTNRSPGKRVNRLY